MFNTKIKVIDIRFIACKSLLVQLLKLISYIQYSLDKSYSTGKDVIITLKISNKYKIKLLSAINDTNITSSPHDGEIIIGQ